MTPLPVIVSTNRYGAGCPRLTMIEYASLSFNSRAIALANQPFLRSSRQQTNNTFFCFVDIFLWPLCSTSRLPQLCKEGIQTKLLAWKHIIHADIKRPAALLPLSHHSCQLNDEIPPYNNQWFYPLVATIAIAKKKRDWAKFNKGNILLSLSSSSSMMWWILSHPLSHPLILTPPSKCPTTQLQKHKLKFS